MAAYRTFMKTYYPAGDPDDVFNVWGYSQAQTMEQVLKQCGDELTRENVMRQAANLKDLQLPMLLPGIRINTSPTRLLSHQASAADEVRRQAVGPLRRGAGPLITWSTSARGPSIGADVRDQAGFLTQAVHQPLELTSLPVNSAQGPVAASGLPE